MFSKKIIISALVVAFSLSFFGTAIAGAIDYPPGVISNLDHTTADIDARLEAMVQTENKVVKQTVSVPAGVVSNLDHTTAEIDAQLYHESIDSNEAKYVSCNVPAVTISNLDHTTAEFDVDWGC
jgi:hypothetical protein